MTGLKTALDNPTPEIFSTPVIGYSSLTGVGCFELGVSPLDIQSRKWLAFQEMAGITDPADTCQLVLPTIRSSAKLVAEILIAPDPDRWEPVETGHAR